MSHCKYQTCKYYNDYIKSVNKLMESTKPNNGIYLVPGHLLYKLHKCYSCIYFNKSDNLCLNF